MVLKAGNHCPPLRPATAESAVKGHGGVAKGLAYCCFFFFRKKVRSQGAAAKKVVVSQYNVSAKMECMLVAYNAGQVNSINDGC